MQPFLRLVAAVLMGALVFHGAGPRYGPFLALLVTPPLAMGAVWYGWAESHPRLRRLELDAWIYLYPALLVLVAFHLIPVVYSFALSLHEASAQDPFHRWVGFANYQRLVQDAVFWRSLANTAWYAAITVVLSVAVGLAFALLLDQKLRGLGIYRTLYFLPVVTSVAAVSLVWKLLYHPQRGILNQALVWLGLPGPQWLEEGRGIFRLLWEGCLAGSSLPSLVPEGPSLALVSVCLMGVWKGFGYNVVLFLAGLQNIPEELYEAATIDGAGAWHRFRHVTWPLLGPMTFFVLIMSTISSFQVFAQIFMLYAGNATEASRVIVYYLYEKAFQAFDLGYGSALAYVLFLVIFTLTTLQKRFVGSKVHYANSAT